MFVFNRSSLPSELEVSKCISKCLKNVSKMSQNVSCLKMFVSNRSSLPSELEVWRVHFDQLLFKDCLFPGKDIISIWCWKMGKFHLSEKKGRCQDCVERNQCYVSPFANLSNSSQHSTSCVLIINQNI